MSQNVVYKTFELNTDVEHKAKPINLSGATTIKLTELPTGVKCWISTESNGTNLFPLINRGDGWVNMPNPLYNLYIYTEGTTLDNQKILLNFTGQNDFFAYGNNSSERIDKVGKIESFSHQALIDLNNAINNYYTLQEPIVEFSLLGEFKLGLVDRDNGIRVALLPQGLQQTIQNLQLKDDVYYRIRIIGHLDAGSSDSPGDSLWYKHTAPVTSLLRATAHLCLFRDNNGATYTNPSSDKNIINEYPSNTMFLLDKSPYATKQDIFDLYGLKFYRQYLWFDSSSGLALETFQDTGIHIGTNDFIIKGSMFNSYNRFGVLCNINSASWNQQTPMNPGFHSSLLITISNAYQNFIE